jgi:predicted RNA-binding protein with PUA-like domain
VSYWLLKSEPGDYSWQDMERDKKTVWSGITNTTALMHIRTVKDGDQAFFYHSGGERRIVGVVRVAGGPYPDPKRNDPKLVVVNVECVGPVRTPVSLDELKAVPELEGWDLFRIGRLSFVPVSSAQWKAVMKKAGGMAP